MPSDSSDKPIATTPQLPGQPLRDSLSAYRRVLGDNTAWEIRVQAHAVRSELDLGRLPEEELREWLPRRDPFAAAPRDRRPLSAWPKQQADAAVRMAAIEGHLIDDAGRAYASLAQREEKRRKMASANPLAAMREVRGEEVAEEVARRAAVLASHLDSVPERDRQTRTAARREEIARVGLENASLVAMAQAVALQHGRNVHNEREAARLREHAPVAEVAAGGEVGIGG